MLHILRKKKFSLFSPSEIKYIIRQNMFQLSLVLEFFVGTRDLIKHIREDNPWLENIAQIGVTFFYVSSPCYIGSISLRWFDLAYGNQSISVSFHKKLIFLRPDAVLDHCAKRKHLKSQWGYLHLGVNTVYCGRRPQRLKVPGGGSWSSLQHHSFPTNTELCKCFHICR